MAVTIRMCFFWMSIFLLNPASADDRPLLSGRWEWLPEKSDVPDKLIAEGLEFIDLTAIHASKSESRTVPVRDYGRKPAKKQVDSVLHFFDTVVPMQPLVSIEHREPWVKLVYTDGREREIYSDGRDLAASVQTTAAPQDQKLQFASWEEDILVIETHTGSGVSVLERYALERYPLKSSGDNGARQLRVEMSIDSARLPDTLTLNYRYEPADEE